MKSFKQDIKSGLVRGVVFLATILAGGIIYAAIGSTWTSPATLEVGAGSGLSASSWNKLLENFNNLDGRLNNISVPQFLGQAEQNANLTVTNQIFTDFPGTSVTFNLASTKKVGMRAYGSVTPGTPAGGVTSGYTTTHCGFRFVIDGTPYGDVTWGDQIIGCGAPANNSYGVRCNWNIEKVIDLSAGSHTIKVQMKDRAAGYFGCYTDTANYNRARLFVETKN